jgi:transcriptional regulator with XRE-family HTH domain
MPQVPRVLHPEDSPLAAFGARVRELRTEQDLSQAELGRRVHVSKDLITKVEKAVRRALPDLVERLDAALDAGGELAALAELAERHPPARSGSAPALFPTGAFNPETVAALREAVAGCRRLDHSLGPAAALEIAVTQVRLVENLLHGLPVQTGDGTRRDLLGVLAELNQLVGWLRFDQGYLPHAVAAFTTARALAEDAGDAALVAYILGPSHGFAVSDSGDPATGVELCHQALDWCGRADNHRLTGFVHAVTARAHARLGDAAACERHLDAAAQQLARSPVGEPVPAWLTVFDRAALSGHRGSCLVTLGRMSEAVSPLQAEASAPTPLFVRNRSLWLLHQAQAHLAVGDLDAACATTTSALPLCRTTTSPRPRRRLLSVVRGLRTHRDLQVRQLLEQVRLAGVA